MATLAYFTVPKILDTDSRFASLSVEAKYLYARMRDTMKLSIQNNWRDRLGVYIKMSRENMAALLGRSLPTIRKILTQLRSVGLILDLRVGLTQCNRIYVRLLPGEQDKDLLPGKKGPCPSVEKQGFSPDRNAFTLNNHNLSQRNPINPKSKRWFIKNGDIWMDGEGSLWQFTEGDVVPYYTRSDLKRLVNETMPKQVG